MSSELSEGSCRDSTELRARLREWGEQALRFLEAWGRASPTVVGIPLIQAANYDIIQAINQAILEAEFGQDPPVSS